MLAQERDVVNAKARLSRTALKMWSISLLFAVLLATGCSFYIPPIESGVRVETVEVDGEMQSITVPISNANDFGVAVVTFGGSGAVTFSGFTNSDGYDDHPSANADAEWQFVTKFEGSSAPNCPDAGPVTHNGPAQGPMTELVQCFVY